MRMSGFRIRFRHLDGVRQRLPCPLTLSGGLPAQQPAPQKADSILILKKDHLMELLAGAR